MHLYLIRCSRWTFHPYSLFPWYQWTKESPIVFNLQICCWGGREYILIPSEHTNIIYTRCFMIHKSDSAVTNSIIVFSTNIVLLSFILSWWLYCVYMANISFVTGKNMRTLTEFAHWCVFNLCTYTKPKYIWPPN